MWRRTYLLLLLIRVYFALSPSYLHPDENFQGPEVFAGRHFSYPSTQTWEFTSEHPIRSVFPLWPVYDVPLSLLKWFYTEMETGNPPPELVYYVLRGVMFLLTFVLEDWAIYEFVPSPRHRQATMMLVASSYVTWTFQTHTFSNSLETLLVAWGLVLIRRIDENKLRSSHFSCAVLAFIAVAGVFNRITFPAFLVLPGLQLLPHFLRKPFSLLTFIASGLFFFLLAIVGDTIFYKPTAAISQALRSPIVTPLNNFLYNSNASNLASHGLHPHYQHFLANLPQLLGPAYVLLIISCFSKSKTLRIPSRLRNIRAASALSATVILSVFPHQEPRFLLPCVPLLLTCFRVDALYPRRLLVVSWVVFNAAMGVLMGIYHQGGVIPTQLFIPDIVANHAIAKPADITTTTTPTATVFWWKTYSPPLWLLGDTSQSIDITTKDLMGIPGPALIHELDKTLPSCHSQQTQHNIFVVAPKSATFLDHYQHQNQPANNNDDNSKDDNKDDNKDDIRLQEVHSYTQHLNLDDLDFGDDGIFPTLKRVVGRRGLGVWVVWRGCPGFFD